MNTVISGLDRFRPKKHTGLCKDNVAVLKNGKGCLGSLDELRYFAGFCNLVGKEKFLVRVR